MTDADTVERLFGYGAAAAKATVELKNGGRGVLVPEGFQLKEFYDLDALPGHIKATPVFRDSRSFLAYLNEFQQPNTMVFAQDGIVVAVIDYHGPNAPDHAGHVVTYKLQTSLPWDTWAAMNGARQGQAEFADFIRENRRNVVKPEAAALLELLTDLKVNSSSSTAQATSLKTGATRVAFTSETDVVSRDNLTLPETFTLRLTPYTEGPTYEFEAFLRVRVIEKRLNLSYQWELPARKYLDDAFANICATLEEGLGRSVLQGVYARR